MKIAVTGAAGFVGSAVVRECLRQGYDVHAVDNLSTGRRGNLPADVELDHVDAIFADYSADDAIIHCAAYADISNNWASAFEREKVWNKGAELTRVLLERFGRYNAAESQRRPFVYVSTCAVYGGGRILDEDAPIRCESPYVASKLAGEALVSAHHAAGRILGNVARLVSCVGRNYWHGHVADFVRMGREGIIRARDDGSQTHSYVHVDDAAAAIVALVKWGTTRPVVCNVSSREVWSWRDTVEIMCETRPVTVECEQRASAWIGDTLNLHVDGLGGCDRPVADGVREALVSLGWRT